jgi:hypothetical protein
MQNPVSVPLAVVPLPVSNTVCGLPTAVLVTLIAAVRAPVVVGLNVTLMVQLALGVSEVPQV